MENEKVTIELLFLRNIENKQAFFLCQTLLNVVHAIHLCCTSKRYGYSTKIGNRQINYKSIFGLPIYRQIYPYNSTYMKDESISRINLDMNSK